MQTHCSELMTEIVDLKEEHRVQSEVFVNELRKLDEMTIKELNSLNKKTTKLTKLTEEHTAKLNMHGSNI